VGVAFDSRLPISAGIIPTPKSRASLYALFQMAYVR
jgi:hypothetical protein